MADRVLFISWGASVHGREERGLEVFNEALGLYGRMQQEGRIESFEVALMNPATGMNGYIALHGSADQIAAAREADDVRATLYDASLIVQDLKMTDGFTGEALAHEIEAYQKAIAKVPQHA
jgi:hypothetical protein